MKLFQRREKKSPAAVKAAASYSVIDAHCTVRGDITCEGTVRVDGRLDGNILGATLLVLGAGASIGGNVSARELVIGGTIEGSIMASARVELESTAVVAGDIEAEAILVDEGAVINGRLRMTARDGTSAERPAATRSTGTRETPRMAMAVGGVGRPTPRSAHLAIASKKTD